MKNNIIRVLIADDHPLMREAIVSAIEDEDDLEVVGQASNGLDAVRMAAELAPDLITLDLLMPGMDGLEALAHLREANPAVRVLVLTSSTSEDRVLAAVRAGAQGYLSKDTGRAELLAAVRAVAGGQAYLPPGAAMSLVRNLQQTSVPREALTTRELEVIRIIAQGVTTPEAAAHLNVSEATVRTHIHHLLTKLGLQNRAQLILFAQREGLDK